MATAPHTIAEYHRSGDECQHDLNMILMLDLRLSSVPSLYATEFLAILVLIYIDSAIATNTARGFRMAAISRFKLLHIAIEK